MGLGKQTGLSRPYDAALLEAAMLAQAHLRSCVDDQRGCQTLAVAIRHNVSHCQMPQSAVFDQTLRLELCAPPESPVVSESAGSGAWGLASSCFGVASGQCHGALALRA